MSYDNSNETSMDADDIAIVFEGAEVFVRRRLGHTCVPLGHPAELAEYDALLRKAIEDVRCVTLGYWYDAGCRAAVDSMLLGAAQFHLFSLLHGMLSDEMRTDTHR